MKQHDTIQRFLFEDHGVRGEIAHLNESYLTIMRQHAYPLVVQGLLGQALMAAVLMMNTIKIKGQLTLQFQSDGPIRMLVAKCDSNNHIRGLAQFDPGAISEELEYAMADGHLVVTIERDDVVKPYQSIVPLKRRTITEALADYFAQSEQLPTQFLIAVEDDHVAGMMLQAVPERQLDDEEKQAFWQHASMLAQTLTPDELFTLDNEVILHRLYHQEKVRLYDLQPIEFRCRCSIERMENAIKTLGKDEALEEIEGKQEIIVTCEYCNHEFAFDRDHVMRLFS